MGIHNYMSALFFMNLLLDLQGSFVLYKISGILFQFPSEEVRLTVFCNSVSGRREEVTYPACKL